MQRTSLMLPKSLQRQAAEVARRQGISLGELVRRSLVREAAAAYQTGADPFWADTAVFHSGRGDLAERHDDELYGPIQR
jgi:hypothetical protein